MDKYWMVHNPNGEPPRARHFSEESAINEAKRLARMNPDKSFIVLEATHHVRKVEVEVTRMTESLEGPF